MSVVEHRWSEDSAGYVCATCGSRDHDSDDWSCPGPPLILGSWDLDVLRTMVRWAMDHTDERDWPWNQRTLEKAMAGIHPHSDPRPRRYM